MKKIAAVTMIELMVASSVLLLMVSMTSYAVIGYVRAYHQYTEKGLRLRQTAKVLEVVCQHLRSAEAILQPDELARGFFVQEKPLSFHSRTLGPLLLRFNTKGKLELQGDKNIVVLGTAPSLYVKETGQGTQRRLHLTMGVEGAAPLETDLPLRGVSL